MGFGEGELLGGKLTHKKRDSEESLKTITNVILFITPGCCPHGISCNID